MIYPLLNKRIFLVSVSAMAVLGLFVIPSYAKGGSHGGSGGMSESHVSTQGAANTNGPNSADREKGQDRAQDRMNAQGTAHNKSHGKSNEPHGKKSN